MKKFACLVLALAMVLSLSISANAANPDTLTKDAPSSDAHNVTVKIEGTEGIVYHVKVEWKDLAFTYSGTKTWDPSTHTYTTEPKWTTSAIENAIVVKNHSNASVTVSTSKTEDANSRNVKFNVTTEGNETLNSAVGTSVETPPSVSYKVAVDTTIAPNDLTTGTFTVGTITVTITP